MKSSRLPAARPRSPSMMAVSPPIRAVPAAKPSPSATPWLPARTPRRSPPPPSISTPQPSPTAPAMPPTSRSRVSPRAARRSTPQHRPSRRLTEIAFAPATSTPATPSRFTLNLNEVVTVAGGTPTLTLNDGGVATYTGGSGSNALTFSYTVAAGQNTASLAATAVNLNSRDRHRRRRQCRQSLAHRPDPERTADRHLDADHRVAGRVTCERRPQCRQHRHVDAEPERGVTVTGGTPTLTLNDGGTATYTRRLRHQCADLQLHCSRRAEHPRPRRHGRQSQLRDRHRRRWQCRQPLALRSHPERPADRHLDADHRVLDRVAFQRPPQRRRHHHLHPQPQ